MTISWKFLGDHGACHVSPPEFFPLNSASVLVRLSDLQSFASNTVVASGCRSQIAFHTGDILALR